MWSEDNKMDVIDFIDQYEKVKTCKLLLSKNDKFKGLKKSKGDFKLENKFIRRWINNDPLTNY